MAKHDREQHRPADQIPDVDYIRNEDTTHERSDVNVGLLFKFIGALTVSVIVILFAMKYLSNAFERREESLEWPPASRVNPPGTQRLPPMPRLQGAPGNQELPLEEMQRYRREENAALTGYSWVDRGAGVVRIPIEEAKRMLVERGAAALPAAAPAGGAAPGAAKPPAPRPAARTGAAGGAAGGR
jgi:hypothetical protein